MASEILSHSPLVSIYLEVPGGTIRLADVLDTTAIVDECAEFIEDTIGMLVISVDGVKTLQQVMLYQGSYKAREMISFAYLSPHISPE